MLLFINACVRENSRTERLAKCLLEKLDQPFTEVRLEAVSFPVTNEAYLTRRDQLIEAGDFSDPSFSLAHQFASADRIVIAAPYWDLSFPAALKQYFEHINVRGITFTYTPEGIPRGLCRAKEIILRYDCWRQLCAGRIWLWLRQGTGSGLLRNPGCEANTSRGTGH